MLVIILYLGIDKWHKIISGGLCPFIAIAHVIISIILHLFAHTVLCSKVTLISIAFRRGLLKAYAVIMVMELVLVQMLVVGSRSVIYWYGALSVICTEDSCHVVKLLPILFLG